jgi:hypothetical protein
MDQSPFRFTPTRTDRAITWIAASIFLGCIALVLAIAPVTWSLR